MYKITGLPKCILIQQKFIKSKNNSNTLYTMTWDTSHPLVGWDHIWSYIVKDVCLHNQENIKHWDGITREAHCCLVLLIQQYGLYWLTFVTWNYYILKLLMKGRVTGTGSTWWTYSFLFLVNLWKWHFFAETYSSWCVI
jgi:hypothetical protein